MSNFNKQIKKYMHMKRSINKEDCEGVQALPSELVTKTIGFKRSRFRIVRRYRRGSSVSQNRQICCLRRRHKQSIL